MRYCKIRWERYINRRKCTQCFNCQQFGHADRFCNDTPKCMFCAEPHDARTCIMENKTKTCCLNCKGEHRGNDRNCPVYAEHLNHFEERKRANRARNYLMNKNKLAAPVHGPRISKSKSCNNTEQPKGCTRSRNPRRCTESSTQQIQRQQIQPRVYTNNRQQHQSHGAQLPHPGAQQPQVKKVSDTYLVSAGFLGL